MKKNRTDKINKIGISLISLIITIIVIIILAAIVIFSGLNTPDRANLAKFMQEISDFRTAITQDFMNKKAEYAISGRSRSDAQIYNIIASGADIDMNEDTDPIGTVDELTFTVMPEGLTGNEYYEIVDDTNVMNWKANKGYYEARGESGEIHYVTDAGEPFILPGYLVQENGQNKWYINEKKYYISETPVRGDSKPDATSIWAKLEVGDWVEYDPDVTEYILSGDYSGTGTTQTIPTETEAMGHKTKWRVWEKTRSNIVIIPEHSVNYFNVTNGTQTGQSIKYSGPAGYVNGITVTNEICKRLYQNSTLGVTANNIRSIKIEDIEAKATYDKEDYVYSTYKAYGEPVTYNSSAFGIRTFYTPLTDGSKTANPTGIVASDSNPVKVNNTVYFVQGDSNIGWKEITTTKATDLKYGNLLQGPPGWLASAFVNTYSDGAYFDLGFAYSDYVGTGVGMCDSYGSTYSDGFGVVPLVSLSSKLHIDTTATDRDGAASATAWKIVK